MRLTLTLTPTLTLLQAEGSHASSSLSLGAKQPALVPYGDEPYSDPPRRFGSVSV